MDLAKLAERKNDVDPADMYPIVVRCYALAGVVKGLGQISVDSQQVVRSDIGSSDCCARVTIETHGDYPQTGVAIIDYKDIERVCLTLERVRGTDPKVTKFNFMEAMCEFGDLKVVVFNTLDNRMFFSAQAHSAQVHMELIKLNQFIDVLRQTKVEIEKRRMEIGA